MVKKIISVDLNFPEKTEPPIETAPEVEDQKDEYAEVKEDANIIEAPTPEAPKPKRKAAAKKPVTAFASAPAEAIAEVEVETETVKEAEPVKETPIETTQPKSEDTQKVKCQHCNKEMTLKSLKYSHSKNCLGLKKTIEKVRNEKVSQKTASAPPTPPPPSPIPYTNIPVKIKQPQPAYNFPSSEPPPEHPRVARMKVLKEKYNNLVQNAFNV